MDETCELDVQMSMLHMCALNDVQSLKWSNLSHMGSMVENVASFKDIVTTYDKLRITNIACNNFLKSLNLLINELRYFSWFCITHHVRLLQNMLELCSTM
jgi:hypothetical protein